MAIQVYPNGQFEITIKNKKTKEKTVMTARSLQLDFGYGYYRPVSSLDGNIEYMHMGNTEATITLTDSVILRNKRKKKNVKKQVGKRTKQSRKRSKS